MTLLVYSVLRGALMEGFYVHVVDHLSKLTMIAYLPLKFFHQFIIFSFLFFKTEQHLTASANYSISCCCHQTALLLLLNVHAQEFLSLY